MSAHSKFATGIMMVQLLWLIAGHAMLLRFMRNGISLTDMSAHSKSH